jgi:hypothetical protein
MFPSFAKSLSSSHSELATRFRFLISGCWLLVTGYLLPVAAFRLLASYQKQEASGKNPNL